MRACAMLKVALHKYDRNTKTEKGKHYNYTALYIYDDFNHPICTDSELAYVNYLLFLVVTRNQLLFQFGICFQKYTLELFNFYVPIIIYLY